MDWITDHLQLIIAVAGAFAYWLTTRKSKSEDGEKQPPVVHRPASHTPAGQDMDENVRRIQEEIRRKVMERANQGRDIPEMRPSEPPPLEMPRPAAMPPHAPEPPQLPRRGPVVVPTAVFMAEQREERELTEALRRAEERRRETRRMADAAQQQAQAFTANRGGVAPSKLVSELRDPASLRRAIVLREILDKPVSLR